jgi:hypothetical protein
MEQFGPFLDLFFVEHWLWNIFPPDSESGDQISAEASQAHWRIRPVVMPEPKI